MRVEKKSPIKSKPGIAFIINRIKNIFLNSVTLKYRKDVTTNNNIEQITIFLLWRYFSIKLCLKDTTPKIKSGKYINKRISNKPNVFLKKTTMAEKTMKIIIVFKMQYL